jgi:glycosyltransferase involved in cell wall biosynthesis
MPIVSIVMPCYNAVAHLPTSVSSVLAQTCTDWELIAVDDGSIDSTRDWLYAQTDPRIHVLSQTNQGVSAARNAGLHTAQGEYVAFLDADDTWAAGFLEQMIAALNARPDAVLAYCGWQNLGLPGGRGLPFVPPDYETPSKADVLFAGCRWPVHAALVRRKAVLAVRGFKPELKQAEDYALWLELAIPAPIVRVPVVLAHYHFHGGLQASSNKAQSALLFWRAQRDYLDKHPEFARQLGNRAIRRLTLGTLLAQGYALYWKRELPAARKIFRQIMRQAYGTVSDWKYMLPAWLPESWHRRLIRMLDTDPACTHAQD